MRLDDIYRSDTRFDKMGAAEYIINWYDDVYELNDQRKTDIEALLDAQGISEEDPEVMLKKLLQLDAQVLSRLYRNIKSVMRKR